MLKAHIIKAWCLVWLLAGCGYPARAQEGVALEHQVKAAFLVKFALFVQWPESGAADRLAPFTIGILGEDPFGPEFDSAIRSQTANGRPFAAKRLSSLAGAGDCQILFISRSEESRVREILAALQHSKVLTVSEMDGFGQRGGMINFTTVEGKIRLEINPDAAKRAGLKVSAKLLQVSRIVRDQPDGGKS